MAKPEIRVQFVWAQPDQQTVFALSLPNGSCVADAISAVIKANPQVLPADVLSYPVAIYGRLATPVRVLREDDRIELLRPLIADPKDQRRARVVRARKARKTS